MTVESVNLLEPTYHKGNKELQMCLDGLMFPNLFKSLYNTGNQEFHVTSGGSTLPKYLELYYRGNKDYRLSLHEFGVIQCLQTCSNHHTTQGLPVWEFQKLPHSLDSSSTFHSTLILHSFLLHILLLQFYCSTYTHYTVHLLPFYKLVL